MMKKKSEALECTTRNCTKCQWKKRKWEFVCLQVKVRKGGLQFSLVFSLEKNGIKQLLH